MNNLSSLFNKRKKNENQNVSGIDNGIFIREDFEGKKLSELSENEVEYLVAYIMRD